MTPEKIARECALWAEHRDLPWNLRSFLVDVAKWAKEVTTPDEIGAAIASEWGEGVERMDPSDIAKVAAEGARRARRGARESPEVKTTELLSRMRQFHDEIVASDGAESGQMFMMGEAADCIATLIAEVARLKAEIEEVKHFSASQYAALQAKSVHDSIAREATAREEEREACAMLEVEILAWGLSEREREVAYSAIDTYRGAIRARSAP